MVNFSHSIDLIGRVRADLDVLEMKKNSYTCREWNPTSSSPYPSDHTKDAFTDLCDDNVRQRV
jgi:hypothetical protein